MPSDIHMIKCPLIWFHMPQLDIYVAVYLISGPRIALIDSGEASSPSRYIFPYMNQNALRPEDISILVNTHSHPDHAAGDFEIRERFPTIRIAAHKSEVPFIEDPQSLWNGFVAKLKSPFYGWTEVGKRLFIAEMGKPSKVDIQLVDKSVVMAGDRELEVLHTPGHSPGSICLYDRSDGILITGDSVQCRGTRVDPCALISDVTAYVASLQRLRQMNISLLLTGHPYQPFEDALISGKDVNNFIDQSLNYTEEMEAAILEFLKQSGGPQNVGEIGKYVVTKFGGILAPSSFPINFTIINTVGGHLNSLLLKKKVEYNRVQDGWEIR